MPSFELEKKLLLSGYKIIAGVDEVGRGALAGPLLAAAVVFDIKNEQKLISEVKDSKKISSKNRERLSKIIIKSAKDYGIGIVDNFEIDKMGIGSANVLAFRRALLSLKSFDFALIDGRSFRGLDFKYKCHIKGEDKSFSIAAASIIAKVERDEMMNKLPNNTMYNFSKNKGYGSKEHLGAIRKYGPSPVHRKSFIRNYVDQNQLKF